MSDNPERAWQHPWLRVNCLIRGITDTRWSVETWPTANAALGWALAERGPAAAECLVELERRRALLRAALGFPSVPRPQPPEVALLHRSSTPGTASGSSSGARTIWVRIFHSPRPPAFTKLCPKRARKRARDLQIGPHSSQRQPILKRKPLGKFAAYRGALNR